MSADRVRRRVTVYGHVQGVFFRDSVREQAIPAGIHGWVHNCADGAVEALLEGPADGVERLVRFLKTGPPRARVERVEVRDESPEGLTGFEIR